MVKETGCRVRFEPVIIENVYPELDCGRYPVKREVSDRFEVWADLFKEGHDSARRGVEVQGEGRVRVE